MRVLSKEQVYIELNNIKGDGKNDILLDDEDIATITQNKDLVLMEAKEYIDKDAAYKTIYTIVSDFEKVDLSHMNVDGILIYFQIHSAYKTMKLYDGLEIINNKFESENIGDEPDILFGIYYDDSLHVNYVKATVFFALSKKEKLKYVNTYSR
ncbi:hypothetical protein [Sulfurimonas sp.]|uniref:hypothetical protein n=1 Tax=Sulfurimonas sp. TaxID=2022749 RepID=UPI0035699F64